jgi:hypothetical protein
MALTDKQRAELEALGPETVRFKLLQGGPGKSAAVPGFDHAVTRGDAEEWLAEKWAEEVSVQHSTLRWAKIAGWAAILSVVLAIVGIGVAVWLSN